MTLLEKLKKQKEKYEDRIEELEGEIFGLEDKIWELENDPAENYPDWYYQMDLENLNNRMKFDALLKAWDQLTLEDIEAITEPVY